MSTLTGRHPCAAAIAGTARFYRFTATFFLEIRLTTNTEAYRCLQVRAPRNRHTKQVRARFSEVKPIV